MYFLFDLWWLSNFYIAWLFFKFKTKFNQHLANPFLICWLYFKPYYQLLQRLLNSRCIGPSCYLKGFQRVFHSLISCLASGYSKIWWHSPFKLYVHLQYILVNSHKLCRVNCSLLYIMTECVKTSHLLQVVFVGIFSPNFFHQHYYAALLLCKDLFSGTCTSGALNHARASVFLSPTKLSKNYTFLIWGQRLWCMKMELYCTVYNYSDHVARAQ